jgi:alpha-1,2-mannosyltransferase
MDLDSVLKYLKNNLLIKALLIIILFISLLFILKPLTYDNYPDFGVYYHSVETFSDDGNPYNYLGEGFGAFLYPPPALLLFLPFTLAPFLIAGKIFTLISILCLFASVLLLLKIIKVRPFSNLGMFFLILTFNFFPAKFTLGMGQVNNLVLLGVVLFLYFFLKKSLNISGIFLAFSVLLKISPAILLLIPLVNKKWKMLLSFAVSFFIILLVTYSIVGKELFYYFFQNTFPNLFTDTAGAYYNQSLSGFLLRQFDNPAAFKVIRVVLGLVVMALPLFLISQFNLSKRGTTLLSVSVLIVVSLILAGTSWQHHFVWLLIPLLLTFDHIKKSNMKLRYYFVLGVIYFLVALNLKDPDSIPYLLQSHVFFGTLILYLLDIIFLIKSSNHPTYSN